MQLKLGLKTLLSATLRRSVLNTVRSVMLPIALGCLAYIAWNERAALLEIYEQSKSSFLLISIALWIGAYCLSPFFVILVLNKNNHPIGYQRAFKIFAHNLPSRYIPGGIWHTVGRLVDFGLQGFTKRQLTALVFLEHSLAVSFALGIGGISVWYYRGMDGWGSIGFVSALIGGTGMISSWFVVNRFMLDKQDYLSLIKYAGCVVVVSFYWIFAAAAFIVYLWAFPLGVLSITWLEAGGTYLLSWSLGFLAVFAPQGIGVFEFVQASLLSGTLPLGAALVIISGFRLIVLCADAVIWLISLLAFTSWPGHSH